MITEFDDYMIHQTDEPICQPAPSDRNFYGRYWFNGFDGEGNFVFEIAFAIYPNRHVMDGHFSVSMGGEQFAFHTSRRAPMERSEMVAGPMRVEIVKPLRIVRVRIEPNETGIECDLSFAARSLPTQEPKNIMYEGTRLIMSTSRFTQLGRWEGNFKAGGKRVEFKAAECYGTRDRSWGVRPIGEPEAGAPGKLNAEPAVYWVWSPLFFDGFCTQFQSFEDPDGNPTQLGAVLIPLYSRLEDIPYGEDPGRREMVTARHSIEWKRGTRFPQRARFDYATHDGATYQLDLEPMIRFHVLGLGYQHPEWGHAFWKGEQATGVESWKLDEVDPLEFRFIHAHHICRTHLEGPDGKQTGIGTLETLVFGRHDRSGFKSILDGAP